MQRTLHKLTLLLVAGALAGAALAQDDEFGDALPEGRKRKQPNMLHRPAKHTAAEQLQHAQALERDGHTRAAAKQYRALVHKWHTSPEAATAQFHYAKLLEDGGDYFKAFDEYQYLIDNFTENFDYAMVLGRQFQIANQARAARSGRLLFFRGFAAPERALPLFEQLVANAPNGDRAPESQFYIGLIHETGKDDELAARAFEIVQLRYPRSDFAAGAAFRRACCLRRIADRQLRDEESCRRAVTALSSFVLEFPNDPNTETAEKHLQALRERLAGMYLDQAVFYDQIAHNPRAAIIAYTDFISKFPSSDRKPGAEARLKALEKEVENEDR